MERKLSACAAAPECVDRSIEEHYEQATAQYDLDAQENMARYAMLLTIFTFLQLGISVVGVLYVASTLRQTAETVRLANKAIVAEHRPWIKLRPSPESRPYPNKDGGWHMPVATTFTNVGGGVAQRVVVEAIALEAAEDESLFRELDLWAAGRVNAFKRRDSRGTTLFPNDSDSSEHSLIILPSVVSRGVQTQGGVNISPLFAWSVVYRSGIDDAIYQTVGAYSLIVGVDEFTEYNLTLGRELNPHEVLFLNPIPGSMYAT